EVHQETLRLLEKQNGFVPMEAEELQADLDRMAAEFAKYLKVVRLPMPLPFRNTFRNYTNALLVNKTMIVPTYEAPSGGLYRYPDEALKGFYASKVATTMTALGFEP